MRDPVEGTTKNSVFFFSTKKLMISIAQITLSLQLSPSLIRGTDLCSAAKRWGGECWACF